MNLPPPNRIALYLTSAAGLATSLAAVVGQVDTGTAIGLAAGAVTVMGVVVKWLDGWQKHEDREAVAAPLAPMPPEPVRAPGGPVAVAAASPVVVPVGGPDLGDAGPPPGEPWPPADAEG